MHIHRVKHPAVPVVQRAAAQRHRVQLQISRPHLRPLGADGDFPVPLNPEGAPPASEFTGELIDETPSMWFVQLKSAPAVDGTSMKDIKAEQKAFEEKQKYIFL